MTDYQLTYGGLVFGGVGAAVQLTGVSGLEDAPAIRSSDEPRGFADGMFYGRDFLAGRTVTMELLVLATATQSFRTIVEQLKASLAPSGGASTAANVLQFTLPGIATRRIYCRLRRRVLPITDDYTHGQANGAVEFFAADPRIYDDAPSSLSVGLAAAAGGVTFPIAPNLTFGGASAPNTQVAINAGTFTTKPVITITGPVDTPIVQNVTAGTQLRLNLVLAANDILTIDTDTRSVFLNGTASRRSSLSVDSVWWDLAPGSNTILYAAAATTTSTATLTWRNAYI